MKTLVELIEEYERLRAPLAAPAGDPEAFFRVECELYQRLGDEQAQHQGWEYSQKPPRNLAYDPDPILRRRVPRPAAEIDGEQG